MRPSLGTAGAIATLALLGGSLVGAGAAAAASPHHPASGTADVRFVQTATLANRMGVPYATFISSRATNGKPHALLFVTPNWNPNNTRIGRYDNHPIGVLYSPGRHKWAVFNEDGAAMPRGSAFNVLVVPGASSTAFTVTATHSNIIGDSLFMNRSVTNGHSSLILQVTQNWDPGGRCNCVFNQENIGVWYPSPQWAIFQENKAPMTVGASFNVLVGSTGTGGFGAVVKAISSNSFFDSVAINNSRTNNNSRAMVFATPDWNPGDVGGTYDQAPIGVWYNIDGQPFLKRWLVFNQDKSSMPLHAAFNLLIFQTR